MSDSKSDSEYFDYGIKEIEWLSKRDPALGRLIENVGIIKRKIIPDFFSGIVHAIAGQQISSKAHAAIWQRIISRFIPFTPETVMGGPGDQFISCGLSNRKQEYILDIANKIIQGQLNNLEKLSDDELLNALIQLRGVGKWTAEMLLIFTFQRKNILSYDDLAIQRGLKLLYNKPEITQADFNNYYSRYDPYASIASFYLWYLANNKNIKRKL